MLVTAILARNEWGRYLPRVLKRCAEFSDAILLLDDGSTDRTELEATRCEPKTLVHRRTHGKAWGQESPARTELWNWASEYTRPVNGWVLLCDADQWLHGDPRPLCQSWSANAWAFPLYDCWDTETRYRDDGPWQGHLHPRPWLFRPSDVPDGWTPQWPARGIHCGHAPMNFPYRCLTAPDDYYWSHFAYVKPSDRTKKFQQYRSQFHQMSDTEKAHAESILDT